MEGADCRVSAPRLPPKRPQRNVVDRNETWSLQAYVCCRESALTHSAARIDRAGGTLRSEDWCSCRPCWATIWCAKVGEARTKSGQCMAEFGSSPTQLRSIPGIMWPASAKFAWIESKFGRLRLTPGQNRPKFGRSRATDTTWRRGQGVGGLMAARLRWVGGLRVPAGRAKRHNRSLPSTWQRGGLPSHLGVYFSHFPSPPQYPPRTAVRSTPVHHHTGRRRHARGLMPSCFVCFRVFARVCLSLCLSVSQCLCLFACVFVCCLCVFVSMVVCVCVCVCVQM